MIPLYTVCNAFRDALDEKAAQKALRQQQQARRDYEKAKEMIDDKSDALAIAASALLADVRRRHPNEDLRCEYMIALDAALQEQSK